MIYNSPQSFRSSLSIPCPSPVSPLKTDSLDRMDDAVFWMKALIVTLPSSECMELDIVQKKSALSIAGRGIHIWREEDPPYNLCQTVRS